MMGTVKLIGWEDEPGSMDQGGKPTADRRTDFVMLVDPFQDVGRVRRLRPAVRRAVITGSWRAPSSRRSRLPTTYFHRGEHDSDVLMKLVEDVLPEPTIVTAELTQSETDASERKRRRASSRSGSPPPEWAT